MSERSNLFELLISVVFWICHLLAFPLGSLRKPSRASPQNSPLS